MANDKELIAQAGELARILSNVSERFEKWSWRLDSAMRNVRVTDAHSKEFSHEDAVKTLDLELSAVRAEMIEYVMNKPL